MSDLIDRQAAIDTLADMHCKSDEDGYVWIIRSDAWARIDALPTAQPTIFGYDLKQIIVIAEILRKENLPPERVTEALMDIERIVSIVRDEFEETLRESLNQFKI